MEQPEQPAKKRVKDLTPEERKQYNRERKAASRNRLRAARAMAEIPNGADYKVPDDWAAQLRQASQVTKLAIRAELPQITKDDEYIIDGVSEVLLGLKNGYLQRVRNPTGIVAGGWYVDALGSEAVRHVHQHPVLLGSSTFKRLYDELLAEIERWSGKQDPLVLTLECVEDVRRAIDGTYVLVEPKIPMLKPEPKPEPPLPTEREILDEHWRRLRRELDPNFRQWDDLNGGLG